MPLFHHLLKILSVILKYSDSTNCLDNRYVITSRSARDVRCDRLRARGNCYNSTLTKDSETNVQVFRYCLSLFGMGGAYAFDSTSFLDNCVETGSMLSPVDPGEMSDVIDCGLEEIAIIPPSNVEILRWFCFLCLGLEGLYGYNG